LCIRLTLAGILLWNNFSLTEECRAARRTCARTSTSRAATARAHVEKLRRNAFGLFDLHGNVWEWVEDCYHDSCAGPPLDGSVWRGGSCGLGVLRGGAYGDGEGQLSRAALRWGFERNGSHPGNGFRVARTPTP